MEINISEDGFINMLRHLNGGAVVEELDRELMKGNGAIFDHGGNATITLKIGLKRIPNMESAVDISHDVTAKHPKEERPHKVMFVTTGNGVTDQHQKQVPLGLGDVASSSKPSLKKVTKIIGDNSQS